jgi:hypothetical protein
MENGKPLHSLVPLKDFTAILGIDAREEALCAFLLVTATYSIEQYCGRQLLLKKLTGYPDFFGEEILPLREYPVKSVQGVYCDPARRFGPESRVPPDLYHCVPEAGTNEDVPFFLALRKAGVCTGEKIIKVKYTAGYRPEEVPPDLKSACIELAAWNISRYRGRRIGMTGSVRGRPGEGEHPESSMPESVKLLLEPYQRHTI